LAKASKGQPLQRVHQKIAEQLATAILSGHYLPGDSLEGEIEQSLMMGVSRTPYREAIRTLTAKGMLESRPRAGTHVTARHRWNLLDPDVLAWMFKGKPDEQFIHDLFELRGLIEPAAAALAAVRRTPEQIEAMADALERMATLGLATPGGQAADQEFHRLLLEATHNEALATLSSSVGAAVEWTTRYKQRARALPRNPLPEHRAVFNAIVSADADAASRAMTNLLSLALADMGVVTR
jgi:DNA-binding FadR family transcriptional regulator